MLNSYTHGSEQAIDSVLTELGDSSLSSKEMRQELTWFAEKARVLKTRPSQWSVKIFQHTDGSEMY